MSSPPPSSPLWVSGLGGEAGQVLLCPWACAALVINADNMKTGMEWLLVISDSLPRGGPCRLFSYTSTTNIQEEILYNYCLCYDVRIRCEYLGVGENWVGFRTWTGIQRRKGVWALLWHPWPFLLYIRALCATNITQPDHDIQWSAVECGLIT